MAKPIPSDFSFYEFESAEEERLSHLFTSANIYKIRNLLAMRMTERAQLAYDPSHPANFTQQEAALMGEIRAYQQLLTEHNDILTVHISELQARAQSAQSTS